MFVDTLQDLQLWTFACIRLQDKHYVNEGISNEDIRPISANILLTRYYTIQKF